MTARRSPLYFRIVGGQENHVQCALLIGSGVVREFFFYSIYKYLPKYICRIISTIKKTNIGSIQLPNRGPPLCDYARPIGLLPTEPEQLLEMTVLVPCPVLCEEVFCNHIGATTLRGLVTSGECPQLHNRLPWKPWRPLLERIHDRCLPRRLR
jgi:hypothetical protein